MPSFGSLFAGIGGLDLGLERAGWTCRWQVEIDEFCRRVLAQHWPDVPKYGDIRELTGDELERVDLICGGFPCVTVSPAGRRTGEDDARWLWPEFVRLLRVLRPRLVLVENSAGLRARGIGRVVGDLAALGYGVEWESLPAATFGAPHLRDRVFIVADAHGASRWLQPECESRSQCAPVAGDDGEAEYVAFPASERCRPRFLAERGQIKRCEWWTTEPAVGRVAYGVPARVERLRALGNAVVPQVAEWLGRRLLAAMSEQP